MRVILNLWEILGARTGVGHYTAELFRCLLEQAAGDQVFTFPDGLARRVREACGRLRPRLEAKPLAPCEAHSPHRSWRADLQNAAVRRLRRVGRSVAHQYFRAVCRRRDCDLYHEPNFIPIPAEVPTVATLHDLSVLVHPEWHPRERVAHFERNFERGLKQCVHFLAISEFGRQEVIRTLNIPPERVTRTYMGIRAGLQPLTCEQVAPTLVQLGLPPRYLLHVGTIEPRKNLLRLMQAYCALPNSLRNRWPLVLVGGWGWNTTEVADYFHRVARHQGVTHFGYVAEEYLAAVYNGARALVFPTHYEGFGLPPLEMMACGGAVLASTAGAVAEVAGGRAQLIEPEDTDGWRDAMARVLADDDWWRSLRRGATDVARPFTWDRCAADTWRVFRTLGNEAFAPCGSTFRAAG